MMSEPSDISRLSSSASALLQSTDAERIYAIREGTWLAYADAKKVIERMEDLLSYPPIVRMPNMLLVAPPYNGKTTILERFKSLHAPDDDPSKEVRNQPVVCVEMPPGPDITDLYSRILTDLTAQFRPNASNAEMYTQIMTLFRNMGVRMLIIDEIHHILSGGKVAQAKFRNALKSLGNKGGIPIVAAGIEEALNAFNTDPQMSSRFQPMMLPTWRADKNFASLLATLERRMPLKYPSNLKDPATMLAIHTRSEGTIGDMCDLVKELAVDAIRNKTERITLDRVRSLEWIPPSKRREYRQF